MKIGLKILGVVCSFAIGFLVSSCDRSTNKTGKVSIQMPIYLQNQAGILSSGAPPTMAAEIDCFGFLISNSDASSDRANCKLNNGSTGSFSRSLNFKKAVAGFYSGETAEFEVDAGSNRVIHVVGIKTNMSSGAATTKAACHQMLTSDYDSFSKPFLIASSNPISVTSGSTQTISLVNSYVPNSTEFFGDCAGPGSPGDDGGVPGPPVRAVLRLQDNITSVYEGACTAAVVELFDANGRIARANQNLSLNVISSVGLVYTSGDFCDSVGSGSDTLTFTNGDYGRKVLFVKHFSGGMTGSLTMVESTSVLTDVQFPTSISTQFSYTSDDADRIPLRYSILDVHSFRTTFSSLPANPIKVKADECRRALVQVVDISGRPVKAYNTYGGATPADDINTFVTESGTSIVQFSTLNSSCGSAMASPQNIRHSGGFNTSGFARFEYKVSSSAAVQNFNIKVEKMGNGYFFVVGDINSLNPISANPNFNRSFWVIED